MVALPPDFTGRVQITCSSVEQGALAIAVDKTGITQATSCLHLPAALTVMRGTEQMKSTADISWTATGDGIPLSLTFTVK